MDVHDQRRLVAVYEDSDHARRAAAALVRAGFDPDNVQTDDPNDHIASVKGEMRSELIHTVAGPGNTGPWTREMAKGMMLGAVIGGAAGALLSLPFAAFDLGLNVWARLGLLVIVGVSVGTTFGFVIGGGFAARSPDEPLAAESGATVALVVTPHAQAALLRTDAVRIDLVEGDGTPVGVVAERPPEPMQTMRDIGRHMAAEPRED
jgi:hypothetical protein